MFIITFLQEIRTKDHNIFKLHNTFGEKTGRMLMSNLCLRMLKIVHLRPESISDVNTPNLSLQEPIVSAEQ